MDPCLYRCNPLPHATRRRSYLAKIIGDMRLDDSFEIVLNLYRIRTTRYIFYMWFFIRINSNIDISRLGGDSGQRRRGKVVDDSKILQGYIYEGLQEDDRRRLPRAWDRVSDDPSVDVSNRFNSKLTWRKRGVRSKIRTTRSVVQNRDIRRLKDIFVRNV